jgi:hypothetical protein
MKSTASHNSADVAVMLFSNTVDERGRIKGARWRGLSSTPLG